MHCFDSLVWYQIPKVLPISLFCCLSHLILWQILQSWEVGLDLGNCAVLHKMPRPIRYLTKYCSPVSPNHPCFHLQDPNLLHVLFHLQELQVLCLLLALLLLYLHQVTRPQILNPAHLPLLCSLFLRLCHNLEIYLIQCQNFFDTQVKFSRCKRWIKSLLHLSFRVRYDLGLSKLSIGIFLDGW
jgi:hypothetical protein